VCLLLGANVLTNTAGGRLHPDHWVVLNNDVRVDGNTTIALFARGSAVDDDEDMEESELYVDVFTWGYKHYPLNPGNRPMTVSRFLDYFYGYVAAK
jgi:hypothetical protein